MKLTAPKFLRPTVLGMALGLFVGGCGPQTSSGTPPVTPISMPAVSPLVGSWAGEAKLTTGSDFTKLANELTGNQLTGKSKLTLQANGTGYLKVAKSPERPITWRQDGKRIVIEVSGATGGSDSTKSEAKSDGPVIGTVSESGKDMTIDLGRAKVMLTKSEHAD